MLNLRMAGARLGAVVLLTTIAVIPAAPAAAATAPSLGDFVLRDVPLTTSLQSRVEALDAKLPTSGVSDILGAANRTGTWATGTSSSCPVQGTVFTDAATGAHAVPPGRRFCFNSGDNTTEEWYPQGVTTVADARDDGLWDAKQAVLVSWYDKQTAPKKGARITFVNTATNTYRHVLLAYPYINSGGSPTYEAVTSPQTGSAGSSLHAGGIVWYGNYLYVADTSRGFRVFDMRHIFDLTAAGSLADTDDADSIGLAGGLYTGFGYRYVMPQVDWLESTGGSAVGDTGVLCAASGSPKFSYVSLDRSGTDSLISGEYCTKTGLASSSATTETTATPDQYGRVAVWPLNSSTGELVRSADGNVHATAAYRLPVTNVQGATSYQGTWYLSRTGGGATGMAGLVDASPGATAGVLSATATRWAGIGAEDLSVWGSRSELWTVTEYPGKRVLYACPLAATATGTTCGARS